MLSIRQDVIISFLNCFRQYVFIKMVQLEAKKHIHVKKNLDSFT